MKHSTLLAGLYTKKVKYTDVKSLVGTIRKTNLLNCKVMIPR